MPGRTPQRCHPSQQAQRDLGIPVARHPLVRLPLLLLRHQLVQALLHRWAPLQRGGRQGRQLD